MKMKIKNTNIKKEIKEKGELKPLGNIIQENLTYFKIEEVINIFFSLKEDANKTNKNNKAYFQKSLSRIDKNTIFQLKIFLDVLRKNYGDQCIINELYKYIVNKNSNDSLIKKHEENEEIIHQKDKDDKYTNNIDKKAYIFILNKENKKKKFLEIDKINNNWIIPSKSKYLDSFLNRNEIKKNIVGYVYKNNSNNVFFYYPILESNNLIKDEYLKKFIKNKNQLLFVCELFINESENKRCNSYGIYDFNSMNFSLGAIHSKVINDHPHSLKFKSEDSISNKDEIMEIIFCFSKMDIKGALIINENL